MNFLRDANYIHLLNSVGENIIIANTDLQIVWFNNKAREMLTIIGKHLKLTDADQFIGENIANFHAPHVLSILETGKLPYETDMHLFGIFTARLIVDQVLNNSGEKIGYIVTWKDITDFKSALKENKKSMEEMYTPIIGTSIREILLVPLAGSLSEDRLENVQTKILNEISKVNAEYILFDFTGILHHAIEVNISFKFRQIMNAVKLMGAEPIVVGLNAQIVQNAVLSGVHFDFKTFRSFKEGIEFVWKQKGYSLVKSKNVNIKGD